nr:transcriptional regulator [Enterobacter mori]
MGTPRFTPEFKEEAAAEQPAHTLGKYGAAFKLSGRQQIPV